MEHADNDVNVEDNGNENDMGYGTVYDAFYDVPYYG